MTTFSHLARIIPGYALGSLFVRRVERSCGPSRLVNLLLDWQDRARQRHALAQMDDRMLADLGLSRADVAGETRKSFWQA